MSSSRCWLFFKESCVDHCCFCLSPRTGCLVIGYFHLICIIAAMIYALLPFYVMYFTNFTKEVSAEDASMFFFSIYSTYGIKMILYSVYLIFTIILLRGLHQNKSVLVDAFIIFIYMVFALHMVYFIFCFAMHLGMILIEACDLIFLAVSFYFVLVLQCYHSKMKQEEAGTVTYTPDTVPLDSPQDV
ncbi:uncharacterized protein LOC113503875 [Trichoplusia ni]|uniref:Uncharacterized protein LOC113503875 n=1 Tax=Trichoplusia ni TaxID=7111 RepID=A0A7E5WMA2_TRINI|nr:uncharacterized protein LOC113503875 [Trichoplusia ni]XP_026741810.1 uncharacterized protein LOC113503875 [Trichoplusia ni]